VSHEPQTAVLKWYGLWQDGNGNGVLDDEVWLSVNGQRYDATEQYRNIPSAIPVVLALEVPSSLMVSPSTSLRTGLSNHEQGRSFFDKHVLRNQIILRQAQDDLIVEGIRMSGSNELILGKEGTADSIGWVAQATYLEGNTKKWGVESGQWEDTPFQSAMVWVAEPNPWYFSLLFKLGYLLRWLGMLFLFLAFLGRGWVVGVIRQSPWMAGISLAYAPLILLLGLGIRQSWPWLAQGVGWSLYGLLKLIPVAGQPFIRIPDGIHVEVGTNQFWVNIADTCSGMESIGLFAGMYLGLILFNYRQLRLGRALALIVPGLVGTYLVYRF
jgi:hypothetical protein